MREYFWEYWRPTVRSSSPQIAAASQDEATPSQRPVTMLPLLQFLFSAAFLKLLNKIEIRDEAGLFFARHWGMMAFVVGGLLVYAAGHPEARLPIVCAALIEKAALVMLIALNWNKRFGKGFAVTLLFDGACCVIYGLYLAGVA